MITNIGVGWNKTGENGRKGNLLATNHEQQWCQGRRDLGRWRERSATHRLG